MADSPYKRNPRKRQREEDNIILRLAQNNQNILLRRVETGDPCGKAFYYTICRECGRQYRGVAQCPCSAENSS